MTPTMDWLATHVDDFERAIAQGRRAHAYLISGPAGVGKRSLAVWLMRRLLGRSLPAPVPGDAFVAPDAFFVGPEPGKTRIAVEQIRALSAEIGLSSHQGGTKAAMIAPANAMTANAANALLKTLEEPPGDSCLILAADALHYVPATVLSRCIHVKVALPERERALEWLRATGTADWDSALALAAGAPLEALRLRQEGLSDAAAQLEAGLASMLAGSVDPVALAGSWKALPFELVVNWLVRVTEALIVRRMSGRAGPLLPDTLLASVRADIDTKNLFCYLDRLNGLRGLPAGSVNEQLALESLLIAWLDGPDADSLTGPTLPMAV